MLYRSPRFFALNGAVLVCTAGDRLPQTLQISSSRSIERVKSGMEALVVKVEKNLVRGSGGQCDGRSCCTSCKEGRKAFHSTSLRSATSSPTTAHTSIQEPLLEVFRNQPTRGPLRSRSCASVTERRKSHPFGREGPPKDSAKQRGHRLRCQLCEVLWLIDSLHYQHMLLFASCKHMLPSAGLPIFALKWRSRGRPGSGRLNALRSETR